MQTISIHAPREGGDSSANRCRSCWIHFNPRPPRGGRLNIMYTIVGVQIFQSTPPARGATS